MIASKKDSLLGANALLSILFIITLTFISLTFLSSQALSLPLAARATDKAHNTHLTPTATSNGEQASLSDFSLASDDSSSGTAQLDPSSEPAPDANHTKKKTIENTEEASVPDSSVVASSSNSKFNSNSGQATQATEEKEEKQQVVEQYEILVTAPRVEIPLKQNPAATTVVESPVLKNLPRTIAIDEVMKLVPGVKVDNQADGERVHISIRGEGILTERCTRGIRAMVDGIPLDDPSGYISDFYDVDWTNVRRIEVLRGPAAAFYGSSSSGGIINIFTKDGGSDPFSGGASVVRGAYGLKKGQADFGGTVGVMNYHISGSILNGTGYREHSAYSADNSWGKFNFTLSPKVKITYLVGWTNFFNQNPEGLNLNWFMSDVKTLRRLANPDSYTYNEYQRTKRVTNGVVASIGLADNLDMNVTTYYRHTNYTEAVPSSVIHRSIDTPGVSLQFNHRLGEGGEGQVKNYLSAGFDYAYQAIGEFKHPNLGDAVEGPDFLSNQDMYQNGLGAFLLDRVELSRQWGVSGIVRYDRVTNRLADHLQAGGVDLSGKVAYERMTGRVGVTWNPKNNFGLYASWGTGFLPPGTEELVNNPYAYGGYNTHLVAATSMGEEVGARGTIGGNLSYDVALFHMDTKNDFGRYRITSRPLETFYGNVGSTRRNGVETAINWFPVDEFTLRVAYTYYNFKYKTVDTLTGETLHGTWVPNIPQNQLYADGEYRPLKNLRLGAGVEYMSSWYIDSTNVIQPNGYGKTDPYTLVHVRAAYRFEWHGTPFEIMVAGRNIFNVLYYGFTEPDPDGNSYQPAPTAEWSLSMRVGF
ncbi:MAG: TonB-dependent receptor family protein [Candidatus Saccharicenans sp.]